MTNSDEEFTEFSDFPEISFMAAGNMYVNVRLTYSNGTNYSDSYRKKDNVDEVVEAAREYKSAYDSVCVSDNQIGDLKGCEGVFSTEDCECLQDAYDNLMAVLEPYRRYSVEGVLERNNAGEYFLGGYNTPIPEAMAELIKSHYDNDLDIDHLVEFWKKALLNPDEQAREDLFQYIQDHGITITDNGYMLLYKAVTTKNKRVPNDDLAQFVGAKWLQFKNQDNRDPDDYYVYEVLTDAFDDAYKLSKDEDLYEYAFNNLGTLDELFNNRDALSEEGDTVMTDKHTRTFEYNLGEVHSMDREECDSNPSVSCSTGLLHVASL